MRLRNDLHMYHLGDDHIVVNPGRNEERESYIYPMNQAAAMLWESFQGKDFTIQDMADVLCDAYDVSPQKAVEDITHMIDEWRDFCLLA